MWTFDLADSLSNLLAAVEQGRAQAKEAQKLLGAVKTAQEKYEVAIRHWQHYNDSTRFPDKQQNACLKEESLRLKDDLDETRGVYDSAMSFIQRFLDDLKVVMQQLPVDPTWASYRSAINELRVDEPGAWQDPPTSLDLRTLEIRLGDMQNRARRVNTKKPKRQNTKYVAIDTALREIAQSRPNSQKEIFEALEKRRVPLPQAEPFLSSRGWVRGFSENKEAAGAWLSKRWAKLDLPPLPRGPKKSLQ